MYGSSVELLLYPSDEFGGQELPSEKIPAFCTGKGVPVNQPGSHLMAKVQVNGSSADPVWQFAKAAFPGDVPWNFAGMFLFDKEGNCVQRYDGRRAAPDETTLRSYL
uniref:Glutathione peroxidase n=1 Tax=Haptolina ericina TaxID=156174 RepID=A0A7S3AI03_9EUKA|mmetsp:Transcript_17243/g.38692  ORF Transcript_17243/g.38692 Transcript_17243/m.38692 type:complete len:107 (+) Transcript_17243:167-487(+)